MSDEDADQVKPSEQRGGTTPDDDEARGERALGGQGRGGNRACGALGGSDAPEELLGDDPAMSKSVLGETTGSDEPATETGVDLQAGENADATTDAGAPGSTDAGEPDLKDAAAGPRQVDADSSASTRARGHLDDVRRIALALPETSEVVSREAPSRACATSSSCGSARCVRSTCARLEPSAPAGPILGVRVEHRGSSRR